LGELGATTPNQSIRGTRGRLRVYPAKAPGLPWGSILGGQLVERERFAQARLIAADPHMRINHRVDALALLPHAPDVDDTGTPQQHP